MRLPGEIPRVVARSVESDPDAAIPRRVVSPVYQEIHHHEVPGQPGCCLLLTGRLFQHHFSAAFRLRRG